MSEDYPRGIPFKPPEELAQEPRPRHMEERGTAAANAREELAAQEARLRRWSMLLLFASLTAFVAMLATGLYFVSKFNKKAEAQIAADKEKPKTNETKEPFEKEKPKTNETKDPSPFVKADPVSTTPKEQNSSRKPVPPLSGSDRDQFIGSLGSLAGSHLYQTHINLGLLADCVAEEVYAKEDAQVWLERILKHMNNVDFELAALGKLELDPNDKKTLESFRVVSKLLQSQARELKAYWDTGDEKQVQLYHNARELAAKKVEEVLGYSPDQESPPPKNNETPPKSGETPPKKSEPDPKNGDKGIPPPKEAPK